MTLAMLADRDAPILEWIDEARVRENRRSRRWIPTKTPWFGQLMAGPQMLAYLWQVNAWMRDRPPRRHGVSVRLDHRAGVRQQRAAQVDDSGERFRVKCPRT